MKLYFENSPLSRKDFINTVQKYSNNYATADPGTHKNYFNESSPILISFKHTLEDCFYKITFVKDLDAESRSRGTKFHVYHKLRKKISFFNFPLAEIR
ncbi:hypothetical protein T4D_490 [Trichinella pseudospiralis]|uniref:Uncharacterized protein n=1 Tax=Trichinella pseudospiralis TaxID=6337 RepID=A0A0V1FY32_TRIPS|nr:hypothetical protein T4D_490 [Trichinella pseudospiralis]